MPWRPSTKLGASSSSLKLPPKAGKSADKHAIYKILVSEIMLQQTQVSRVREQYPKFLKNFPNFQSLARARTADVIIAWQGMGYNRRALNLQKLATIVIKKYQGNLPSDPELLEELPGIGKATAGSIVAFAFNKPVPFIETNIRRVFIHYFFDINEPRKSTNMQTRRRSKISDKDILPLVQKTLPTNSTSRTHSVRQWYYALMDYGAMLRKIIPNPNVRSAHYLRQSKFEGSARQLRGAILRSLLNGPRSIRELRKSHKQFKGRFDKILLSLQQEGFLVRRATMIQLV